MTKLIALSQIAAFALAASTIAQAAEVTWRMATKQPPDSDEGKAFQVFADQVVEYSRWSHGSQNFPQRFMLGKPDIGAGTDGGRYRTSLSGRLNLSGQMCR